MERVGDHGGTPVGDEVGSGDDPDVAEAGVDRVVADGGGELEALRRGGLQVEVEHVVVGWVVERSESPPQAAAVAGGAGDEVGEAGYGAVGGGGKWW